jgi:hypothetical protein
MDGPALIVEVHGDEAVHHYWVGLVRQPERDKTGFRPLADLADYLCALLPVKEEKAARPWRDSKSQ